MLAYMNRHHDRREIERLLARRTRHDLTYREISEESGIPIPTLSYWGRRLREASDRGEFVPVEVTVESSPRPIAVEVGDRYRVYVEADFDEAHLMRVLQALRSRC